MKSIKLLCVSVFMLVSSAVYAEPAVIAMDFGCWFPDGDGVFTFTEDTKEVVTMGGKGSNVILKCRATGVANSSGETVKWNQQNTGILCGTHYGSTEDWRVVVTPDGNAKMTCKIHF